MSNQIKMPTCQRAHRYTFRTNLLVLLGYFLLSIALTWPLVVHWHTGIVGGIASEADLSFDSRFIRGPFEDGIQNIWNIWWVRRALAQGQNPFWSDMLYYPDGVQMYMQTMNITNALLTLPIHYLAGPIAAYNTAILLAFMLTGYAGFLLVRTFVPGTAIPFLCGVLLTACPFHILKQNSNQLQLISMQWLPFYFVALCWLERDEATKRRGNEATKRRGNDVGNHPRLFRLQMIRLVGGAFRHLASGTWHLKTHPHILRPTLFAVAMFVFVVLTDWYWAVISGVATILWVSTSLVRSQVRWLLLQRYILLALGVLICLTPLFLGMLQVRDHLPTGLSQRPDWQHYMVGFAADALGLFFPAAFHPWWGESVRHSLLALSPDQGAEAWYIAGGWVLLTLAAVGVWVRGREHWRLLVVGGVTWMLSLGPGLRVAGFDTGWPMPFMLLQELPLLSAGRRSSQFAVVCIIMATIFAGIGLYHITVSLSPHQRNLLLLSVAVLAGFELWPTARLVYTPERHEIYTYIHTRPGAVADLPLIWETNARTLNNQLLHEQPILGGYVARWPDYPSLRSIPLVSQIGRMQHWPEQDIVPLSQPALAAMQCYAPIRHVVVTRAEVTDAQMHELTAVLTTLNGTPLTPRFADADYVWYELPLFVDQCAPFLYLGAGWHNREYTDHAVWRWATTSSVIGLVNPFAQPIVVTLRLRAEALADGHPLEVWYADQMIARWEVSRAIRNYRVVVQVPPGSHPIELRSAPAHDQQADREVSLAVTELAVDSYARWEQ